METIIKKLRSIRIVPVVAINDSAMAVPLAKALVAGGIPCAEITFRTTEGEAAMRRIAVEVPEILLGAGTVLTIEQVDRAVAAGSQFIVAPGFNPKIVDYCLKKGLRVVPGCSTPSDMEQAIERGLELVKFFPAEQSGGIAFIKAVSGPYPMLTFLPTGGISPGNVMDYLSFDKVVACGGSWMVRPELIDSGQFHTIHGLCAEVVALIKVT